MADDDRVVVDRADGAKEVRRTNRATKLNAKRKKGILAALAAGNTLSNAAKLAGVSVATVSTERKRDPQFDRDLESAREGFAAHLETEAYRRAVEGVKKDVRWQGRVVGEETVYSDGLLKTMLAANHDRYKVDDGTKVAVVIQPLSTSELAAARSVDRESLEKIDALAKEMASVEREREQNRQIGSGG